VSDSTQPRSRRKPEKPYPGFPLFAHLSGQWAKKINGRLYYFGIWSDPEAALVRLNREWPYLKEGRTPPAVDLSDGCTVRALVNAFLTTKEDKLNQGDLSPRTFRDYFRTCELLVDHFGRDRRVDDLQPEDFRGFRAKLAERLSVGSLKNERNRVRVVFNFAHANGLIDAPVKYGRHFDAPSARILRRARNQAGPKLFSREEVLSLLDAANGQIEAMIYLGVNCAFGNSDCSSLPRSAVDLETGWIEFPRPKTEIARRVPLWPETVASLREAIAVRPEPAVPKDGRLCFLTRQGRPWVRMNRRVSIDALGREFGKLMRRLGINGRRGLGFYTLRHVFETVGGESKDQAAVNEIMGHVDNSMAATYRHGVSDSRLRDVVATVHEWLFG